MESMPHADLSLGISKAVIHSGEGLHVQSAALGICDSSLLRGHDAGEWVRVAGYITTKRLAYQCILTLSEISSPPMTFENARVWFSKRFRHLERPRILKGVLSQLLVLHPVSADCHFLIGPARPHLHSDSRRSLTTSNGG